MKGLARPASWFCCLIFIGAIGAIHAAPRPWHVLETPRFTVVSQLRDSQTREWAIEFDQFISALSQVITVDERQLPPLTIVLFPDQKTFTPYTPLRHDGEHQPVAGFFARQETGGIAGIVHGGANEDLRRTIFHEGVHWYMSESLDRYPPWLIEGIAEVFSTFRIRKGRGTWGEPIISHVAHLQSREYLMPVAALVSTRREEFASDESQRIGLFYAESWALVHHLLFGLGNGGENFSKYLRDWMPGAKSEDIFRQHFGVDYAGMDALLNQYLRRRGKYLVSTLPVSRSTLQSTVRTATPEELEIALARLAASSGNLDKAIQHAEAALARAPKSALAHEALALACERRDPQRSVGVYEEAINLGLDSANSQMLLARFRTQAALSTGGITPIEARRIANLYERAINRKPTLRSAYRRLCNLLGIVEKTGEEDEKFLLLGQTLFPSDGVLWLGRAELARKKGDNKKAREFVDAALANAETLSKDERSYATQLIAMWVEAETLAEIEPLAESGKFSDALEALARAEKRLPEDARNFLPAYRRSILVQQALADARTAANEGRIEDARTMLERIMPTAQATGLGRAVNEALVSLAVRKPL